MQPTAARLPKFHPTSPDLAAFRCFHTGWVFGPLTSIFSVTRNWTPLSAVNLQISAGEPFSWRPNCRASSAEESARHLDEWAESAATTAHLVAGEGDDFEALLVVLLMKSH